MVGLGLLYFDVEMQVFYLHVFICLYLGQGEKVQGYKGGKILKR